jgi:hypothetical protein
MRRSDPRFLLPVAPATATVLGDLPEWADGLTAAGISLDSPQPDVVVAPAALASRAIAVGSPMVILEGHGGLRPLTRAGMTAASYLIAPRLDRMRHLVRIGDGRASRLWLGLGAPASRSERIGRWLVAAAVRAGRSPRLPVVTIGARSAGPPFALAAAASALAVPVAGGWLLSSGGDPPEEKRNIFRVPSDTSAGWVVKVGRVPGARLAGDRDEAGLALARSYGPVVADRVPRPVGRIDVAGFDVQVQTSAGRYPIESVLGRRGRRRARLDLVASIGTWLDDVARVTRTPAADRRESWTWMVEQTSSTWPRFGAPPDLFDRIHDVPGVLQHGDLWAANVVGDRDAFGVVDWEGARAAGLPLADLVTFVPSALATVDGARTHEERLTHFVRLFRGELDASTLLFELVARAAATSDLDGAQVAALVTIALLEAAIPPWAEPGALAGDPLPFRTRLARAWLDTTGLGPTWRGNAP